MTACEEEVQRVVQAGEDISEIRINELADEAEQLGITKEALVMYIMEMMIANGMSLGGDDSWLIQLCKDLGIAVGALGEYKRALNSASGNNVSEKISNLETQAASYAQSGNMAAFQQAQKNIETLKGSTDELNWWRRWCGKRCG